MNLELYSNVSDANVVNKDITLLATLIGDLREQTDILNPSFLIKNVDNFVLTGGKFNYVYVPDFKRYYFVNDIEFISNTLYIVHCHVDVLMTYKAEIKENDALVLRQEFNYNVMLSDPKLKHMANPLVQTLKFPEAFDDKYSYILLVAGNTDE